MTDPRLDADAAVAWVAALRRGMTGLEWPAGLLEHELCDEVWAPAPRGARYGYGYGSAASTGIGNGLAPAQALSPTHGARASLTAAPTDAQNLALGRVSVASSTRRTGGSTAPGEPNINSIGRGGLSRLSGIRARLSGLGPPSARYFAAPQQPGRRPANSSAGSPALHAESGGVSANLCGAGRQGVRTLASAASVSSAVDRASGRPVDWASNSRAWPSAAAPASLVLGPSPSGADAALFGQASVPDELRTSAGSSHRACSGDADAAATITASAATAARISPLHGNGASELPVLAPAGSSQPLVGPDVVPGATLDGGPLSPPAQVVADAAAAALPAGPEAPAFAPSPGSIAASAPGRADDTVAPERLSLFGGPGAGSNGVGGAGGGGTQETPYDDAATVASVGVSELPLRLLYRGLRLRAAVSCGPLKGGLVAGDVSGHVSYRGKAFTQLAKLMAKAKTGQILATADLARTLPPFLAEELTIKDQL
ncbi:hypothetical protein CHLRE_12g535019v5 [Chlamydomonas reinhardtii]|uniref:Uncharacterized protein n=1 Tax=Chlamydomonas reinhardtii TaxID=3055 RepID=A0A2K3D528_CHLRE|nr:uncharacterized protein CHLRE_12g535019v5 [Chlamydomonas reinhardtii]PNW75643.1 hypothetical protein CHLRE_12g535019v5 [Chlamydomonas reinhardtii]